VARHIQALEDELSNRLFHKSNNGYELTEAGERLVAGAEAIESAYVFAKVTASSEGRPISGKVRIGAPDGFGSVFLAPRVRELTDRHPRLEIEILVTATAFSLLKREADITIGLSRPEQMRIVSRRLTDFRVYVYASREYLKQALPIVAVEDLKKHPFIGFVEELCFASELHYSVTVKFNYFDTIGADVARRIRSTSLLAQLHATLSGRLQLSSQRRSSATILSSIRRRPRRPPVVRTRTKTGNCSFAQAPVCSGQSTYDFAGKGRPDDNNAFFAK
jgi:DNA-binding transcriptional LysR family regulator